MKKTAILAALITLTLVVPSVTAHTAPPARDFETRILHDHNDDSAIVLAGQHGFDSIALDVREGRMPTGEQAFILRLLLNGGCNAAAVSDCGTLTQTVDFSVSGTSHNVAFSTDDGGATFYGDAPLYVGPAGINDGERFAIEAWIPMADYGLAPGTEVADWFVNSVDNMPQGVVPGVPDPLEGAFNIGAYTLGEPDRYIGLTAESLNAQVVAGEPKQVNFTLNNLLVENQVITLQIIGGDGPTTLNVAPNFAQSFSINTTAGASGVVVIATSPLGGFAAAATALETASTVDERAFSSPDIASGSSWSHTFRSAGIFAYHNHHMAAVGGNVHIEGHQGNATTHTIAWTGTAFDPEELDIQLGDTVTWVNNGPSPMMIMGGVTADGSDPLAHDHGDHETHGEESPGIGLVAWLAALVGLVALTRRR